MRKSLFIVKSFILVIMSTILLTACCCDDDESTTPKQTSSVQTGHFVDSPVQGLTYETDSQSGITDADGAFTFLEGETITFSISPTEDMSQGTEVILGQTVPAKKQMSPVDLVPAASSEKDPIKNRIVTNISRLLQSIDQDGNPENGITITDVIRNETSGRVLLFDQPISDFTNDIEQKALFDRLNTMDPSPFPSGSVKRELVAPTQAQKHLRESIDGIIDKIVITPEPEFSDQETPIVPIGLEIGFIATAHYKDKDKNSKDITKLVTWTPSDPNIADSTNNINSEGYFVFNAKTQGTIQIKATLYVDENVGTKNLHITDPVVQKIEISPSFNELAKGEILQYKAVGTYSDNKTEDITDRVVWDSSNSSIAAFSIKPNEKGLIEAIFSGSTMISAKFDGVDDSADLFVVDAMLNNIEIKPGKATLAKGQSTQLIAMGRFTDGSFKDITNQVEWISSEEKIARVFANGIVRAEKIGDAKIKAISKTSSTIICSAEIEVGPPVAVSIEILPVKVNIAKGDTKQLTAIATLSDGITKNVTQEVQWKTTNSNLANIDSKGLVDASHVNTYNYPVQLEINAILDNVSAPKMITVDDPAPKSISIYPSSAEIAKGDSIAFTAMVHFTDGTTSVLFHEDWWQHEITDLNTTTFYNEVQRSYSITTSSTSRLGKTDVRVVINYGPYDGKEFKAELDVKEKVLRKIIVSMDNDGSKFSGCSQSTPEAYTLPQGLTPQFTARGCYSDQTSLTLTTEIGWSSSNTQVAIIDNDQFKGLIDTYQTSLGQTTIRAKHGYIVQPFTINVIEPVLTSLEIIPNDITLPVEEEQIFTIVGLYTDKQRKFITADVNYKSSDANLAIFTRTGVLKGRISGNITVTVTGETKSLDGKAKTKDITQTTSVLVINKKPISLSILPEMVDLPLGRTQQYTATLKYADNTVEIVTDRVTWSSSITQTATIDEKGFAQSRKQLTPTVITAQLYGLTDITHLTVTEHALDEIEIYKADEVNPVNNLILQHEKSQPLMALGTYSDNEKKDITTELKWESEDSSIAEIYSIPSDINGKPDIYGVIAKKVGSTKISASHEGTIKKIDVTVQKNNIDHIEIIPSDTSVKVDTCKEFQAIATWKDGYSQSVTDLVNWITSHGSIENGAITPTVTSSNVTVTANYLKVTDTAQLTVYDSDLISVDIIAPANALAKGRSMQLTSTMKFEDLSTRINNPVIRWESTSDCIVVSQAGIITAVKEGTATIRAHAHDIFGAIEITAKEHELVTIDLQNDLNSNVISLDQVINFTAMGTYSDGYTAIITTAATWSSSYTEVALHNNNVGFKGVIISKSVGRTTISASLDNITEEIPLSVVKSGLNRIEIQPPSPKIPVGYSLQLTAIGIWNDDYTQDLTIQSKWSLSDPTLATISDTGLVQAQSICEIDIYVQYTDTTGTNITGTTVLTVPAVLTGVFKDSVVQGLDYETLTQKGTTNALGQFTYLDGEVITFSIGELNLGSGAAKPLMTPIDLVKDAADYNHPTVTAICRLLQSIDSNGYLDDGIEILPGMANEIDQYPIVLNNDINFQNEVENLLKDTEVQNMLTANKDREVVTSEAARTHLRQTVFGNLQEIVVSADNLTVPLGKESHFKAEAIFSKDGHTLDVTSVATWSASKENWVEIDQSGAVKPISTMGKVNILATYEGMTGQVELTIEDAIEDYIVVKQIPLLNEGQPIPLGASVQLTATVFYTDGFPRPETPQNYVWQTSDSTLVTVSPTGMVTVANHIDNYTHVQPVITARLAGMEQVKGTIKISIKDKVLTSLNIDPQIQTIPNGKERSFKVVGTYSNDETIIVPNATFTSESDSITARYNTAEQIYYLKALIEKDKLDYTTSITINCDSVSMGVNCNELPNDQTFELRITDAEPAYINIEPKDIALPLGESKQLSATVIYTDGVPHPDKTHEITWQIENKTVADISSNGTITAVNNFGAYTQTIVKAMVVGQNNVQGVLDISITKEILKHIEISPENILIPNGMEKPFSVIGVYSNGDRRHLTNTTIISEPQVITVRNNPTEKIYHIKGSVDSDRVPYTTSMTISCPEMPNGQNFEIIVEEAEEAYIVLEPSHVVLPLGESVQLTPTVFYTDGIAYPGQSHTFKWDIEHETVADITQDGYVTAKNSIGSYTQTNVTVQLFNNENVKGILNISITNEILKAVETSPKNASIASGEFMQLNAIGTYSNGYTKILSNSEINWTSSQTEGVRFHSGGVTIMTDTYPTNITLTVTATSNQKSAESYITVEKPKLRLLVIGPMNHKINKGESQLFTATGYYTDQTQKDLTNSVTWHSSNNSIAEFQNTTNSIASLLTGTVIITATSSQDGISISTELTILPAVLTGIEIGVVDSNALSVPKGLTLQFFVNATYSDSHKEKIMDNRVQWESSSEERLKFNSSVSGLATAGTDKGMTGTVTVTARMEDEEATYKIEIIDEKLLSISVTPVDAVLPEGITHKFVARGLYSDHIQRIITNSVRWLSSNPEVASIESNTGFATALSANLLTQTTISASMSNITGTALLTVNKAQLVSISISPDITITNATVPKGTRIHFSATGIFTDGEERPLNDLMWSSLSPTVISINQEGHATALTPSHAPVSITAEVENVTKSYLISISEATLERIIITPNSDSLAKGETLQYRAIGEYTDDSTLDITSFVTWSSSNNQVARFDQTVDGKIIAVEVGQTVIITAALNQIQNIAYLDVGDALIKSLWVMPIEPLLWLDPPQVSEGYTMTFQAPGVQSGYTLAFQATGIKTDQSLVQNLDDVEWSTSDSSIATFPNLSSPILTGLKEGKVAVIASTVVESKTITKSFHMDVVALQSIEINAMAAIPGFDPDAPSVPDGYSQLFLTAIGNYGEGDGFKLERDLTSEVDWSVKISDQVTDIVDVSPSGVVSVQLGEDITPPTTFTIMATLDKVGEITLEITP